METSLLDKDVRHIVNQCLVVDLDNHALQVKIKRHSSHFILRGVVALVQQQNMCHLHFFCSSLRKNFQFLKYKLFLRKSLVLKVTDMDHLNVIL